MKKLTYDEVKNYIENKGYKLISTKYEGSDKKLITICPNGSIYKVTYNKFLQGRRCLCCRKKEKELEHKRKVNSTGEYLHIKSYFTGDKLLNEKVAKTGYMEIKHLYCGNEYLIKTINFINIGNKCSKCCHKYENSFAYHIEVELGEPLEKYWDFEKNTVNPYHIYKNYKGKVWIKCQNQEVNELNGLAKKDYHGSYEVSCLNFVSGHRCGYCSCAKVHLYDSFGYHNFNKCCNQWINKKVSPYKVARNSHKKYEFICEECKHIWSVSLANASKGVWCPRCMKSKGEKKIEHYLNKYNINYISQYTVDGLVGVGSGLLSYDFYLPKHNIFIEFHGKQHEEYVKGFHKDIDDFQKQQEHDRRKREYARDKLLVIWYYEFNNIEEILKQQLIL